MLGQSGLYRLVAAPRTPFTVAELPPPLRAYLQSLTLDVMFGAAQLRLGADGAAQATAE